MESKYGREVKKVHDGIDKKKVAPVTEDKSHI